MSWQVSARGFLHTSWLRAAWPLLFIFPNEMQADPQATGWPGRKKAPSDGERCTQPGAQLLHSLSRTRAAAITVPVLPMGFPFSAAALACSATVLGFFVCFSPSSLRKDRFESSLFGQLEVPVGYQENCCSFHLWAEGWWRWLVPFLCRVAHGFGPCSYPPSSPPGPELVEEL